MKKAEEADVFEHTTGAIDVAMRRGLKNVVVLLWFGEKQYDLELPLPTR